MSLKPENLQAKPSNGWELVATCFGRGATERDVSETFAQCGLLKSARLAKSEDGSSLGTCIVEMAHKEGAETALETLQGRLLDGKPLRLEWSEKSKQEMGMADLKAQQSVVVVGLGHSMEFNGCLGRIMVARPDGRCDVDLECEGGAKTLALRSENV